MKRSRLSSFAPYLAAILVFASAGLVLAQSAYEDLLKSMLDVLDRTTALLAKAQDTDSAKETTPELKKAAGEFLEVRTKAAKLEPPNREVKDRLAKEYRPKFEESKKKMAAEIARLKRMPGGKEVLSEIRSILEPEKK